MCNERYIKKINKSFHVIFMWIQFWDMPDRITEEYIREKSAEWKECNQEPQIFFWDNVGNLCKEDPYEFTSSQ